MQVHPQAINETAPPQARQSGPSPLFAWGLPAVIAVYLLGLSAWLSAHRILWLDEFFAWGVLTDRSFLHMLHAWLEGADSGGVLYYILGHTLLAVTGPSVLAARLFGAALLAGAFILWVRILRRVVSNRIALLAGCFLLLSTGYINYLAEVRFYSQLIAAIVLAVWLALWTERTTRSPVLAFALSFLVHGALVSSHLLGIVFSAMLLTALLACRHIKRYLPAASGIIASWSLLLFARQPIHIGGARVAGMLLAPPRFSELLTLYGAQPTALPRINLILYLLLLLTFAQWLRRTPRRWPLQDDPHTLLLRISLLLAATPLLFFAESSIAPWSLWVVRYMLPSILGISGLVAYALAYQVRQPWAQRLSTPTRTALFTTALLTLALLHVVAVRHQVLRPRFTQAQLRPIERGLPVVVANEQLFFQLRFYESNLVPQFYYVHIPLPSPTGERNDLMRTIERQGYWQGSLRTRDELLATTSDFLLLESPQRDADLIADLQRRGWSVTSLGSQLFEGRQTAILRLTGPHP